MAKVKIVLNRSGVRALLRSDESEAFCQTLAQKVADRLDEGYEVTTYKGKNRVNASVKAVSYKAKKENLENNTILKAVCGK